MIKALILESGELKLEKPIDVAELIDTKPRLKQAHATLEARFKALGDKDPSGAATREIESFLTAALGKLGDAYVNGKRSLLNKLVDIQTKIHDLYRDVMRSRSKVNLDVEALRAHYREMQAVFDELGKHVEDVAASTKKTAGETKAKPIDVEATAVPAGKTVVASEVRFGTLKTRKGFKPFVDAVTGKSGWRAKLKAGVVEFFVEDGKLSVRSTKDGVTTTFKEFDVLERYADKPLSTRVMQAHHGCQTELMDSVFGDLYHPNEAPAIWLRDSTGDSPHGLVTHAIQKPKRAQRLGELNPSFGKIRDWAVADLKAAGAPDEAIRRYLKAMDATSRPRSNRGSARTPPN